MTSSPDAWQAATASATTRRTSTRGAPVSAATTLDPSLMTVRLTAGGLYGRRLQVEVEQDAGDLDVVAGLEALGLERAQDAHALKLVLDVHQGLVVLAVVARDQALDLR